MWQKLCTTALPIRISQPRPASTRVRPLSTSNQRIPRPTLPSRPQGNLDGDVYRWHATLDGNYIDLYALKFMQEPASLEISLDGDAVIGPGKTICRQM